MLEHLQPARSASASSTSGTAATSSASRSRRCSGSSATRWPASCAPTGIEVVLGDEVIWRNDIAVRNGKAMAAADVDAVIFNFSVWAWPQYARVAAQFCPQPIAMFSNVNPQYPGLVGMLANAGSLDQAGIRFTKTFGDLEDRAVYGALVSRVLAVAAARRLRGLTYCPDRRPVARHRHDGHRSRAMDGRVRHRRRSRRPVRARAPRREGTGRPAPASSRRWTTSKSTSAGSTGRRPTPPSASPRICCGASSACTTAPSI